MFSAYFKYFFSYIVRARHRQGLLILAVTGLFLSSFALIFLQSTMGGLQNKLMERSKKILGRAVVFVGPNVDQTKIDQVEAMLAKEKSAYLREYEIEVLLRNSTVVSPAVVHGVDLKHPMSIKSLPDLLQKSFVKDDKGIADAVISSELAYRLNFSLYNLIQMVSPAHVDELMGEVPRMQSVMVSQVFSSNVPEIDLYHMWVRLPLIQNLIQKKAINRLRIYNQMDFEKLKKSIKLLGEGLDLRTWEDENSTLVWALKLESVVMIFLFAGMGLLVSLCISTGLLIFFNKVKKDLASFWILGASHRSIFKSTTYFLHMMSFSAVALGILFGLIFLWAFDHFAPTVMPAMFVDRQIPILVTAKGVFISFFIPYAIATLFIYFSLFQFKNDTDFLSGIRSIGNS